MFNFSSPSKKRCGAVIDIGSGSVAVSIVISDPETKGFEVVWSHREQNLIREMRDFNEAHKSIKTTLINALLELGCDGLKKLTGHESKLKVTSVQTTISAPWSYTVTKDINFQDEHPFVVTEDMIEKLIETATKEASTSIAESEIKKQLGLEVLNSDVVSIRLNGYSVTNPINQEGRSLSISYLQSVGSTEIVKTLQESLHKILPNVPGTEHSFMYVYYCVLQNLKPDTSEICLIDVTNEATEIGIVREGALKHVTHANFGSFTIAREVAKICNIPKEEAYAFMKDDDSTFFDSLSENKRSELAVVLEAYESKIEDLFKRTGDDLSIPSSTFLHTDKRVEKFFTMHIRNAAIKTTKTKHNIHMFTTELMEGIKSEDSALALSQHHFDKEYSCMKIATKK